MSQVRVSDLLLALRSKLGDETRRRVAAAVNVDVRAVDLWYQQGPRVSLRGGNVEALSRFAISLGIDPRQFDTGIPLWRPELPLEEQLTYDPGPHPERLSFQHGHVSALGRVLDTAFGSASGPIAQSPLQMFHLAKTGCGFVTTRSFLPYARRANPPPHVLQYVNHTKDARISEPDNESKPCVVSEEPTTGFRPTNGLVSNAGFFSASPSMWVQNVVDARRMFVDDPDTENVLLIVSVAGFAGETNKSRTEIVDGYEAAVRLAVSEAGAEAVEVNIGCPAIAHLVATDLDLIHEIVSRARKIARGRKLILKVGTGANLEQIILRAGPHVDGISCIDSVPVNAVRLDQENRQHNAFYYGTPGLAGAPIFRIGLETCKRIAVLREKHRELRQLTIIAGGGISRPDQIVLYRDKAGAELVALHSAFMEDHLCGIRMRRFLDTRLGVEVKSGSRRREIAAYHWAIALEQELPEVHPTEQRRLVNAASTVLADYFGDVERTNRVAVGKRVSATLTVDEFRKRIVQKFKDLGGGPTV